MIDSIPLTALVAVRNESANIEKCLKAVAPAKTILVLDSHSTDGTAEKTAALGARVIQFDYPGGYPRKRQWALDTQPIDTPWILLLDADEVVPPALWEEIRTAISSSHPAAGYLITKGFHFMGRRFRFGGFSHSAVLLFQTGKARFERLLDQPAGGLDMEVHERLIVDGPVGHLNTPLIHEDFKGLDAYLDRHRRYTEWEAQVRHRFLTTGRYGEDTIQPRFFGNVQERRRYLKGIAMRVPFEPAWWWLYHYVLRLGFLEGRPGWIASKIRAGYIRDVRRRVRELGERPR